MFGNYSFTQLAAVAVTAVAFSMIASTVVGLGLAAVLPATAASASVIGFTSTVASVMGFIAGFPMGMKIHDKISDTYYGIKRRRENPAIRRVKRTAAPAKSFDQQKKPKNGLMNKLSNAFRGSKAKKTDENVIKIINPDRKNDGASKGPGAA
ncbi:MAG: hypothetical protein HND56_04795 [Pseudomonadota bacterium]|jgi:hypothetical protein|nr:hypothetical protein [Pseudomonadota bacterium]QKK05050.1 MAG: hypothetical protein HND56_04795 [Pseudomonadota bacterium]